MSQTYRIVFAYNGAHYAGWQRQINAYSVQQAAEETLRKLFRDDSLALTSCGRTDAGVHALGMTTSFRADAVFSADELKTLLNARLPHDIQAVEAGPAPDGFNAHEDALGKAYVYAVNTGYENLFLKDACWSWPAAPFFEPAVRAVSMLAGTHDFRNFTGRRAEWEHAVRTIFRAEAVAFGPVVCFYFSGDGFLNKMVRRIAGFLHGIATGERTEEEFRRAVAEPGAVFAEEVAPPQGLYLKKVFYRPDEWRADRLEYPPFFY